jgi:hypothetical protein
MRDSMEYEVVYSAALERQGRGITLSGHRGASTLTAWSSVATWDHGESFALFKQLRKYDPSVRQPVRFGAINRWHRNRSKRAA